MTALFRLNRARTGLLLIDVQEKLFPKVERACEVMESLKLLIEGFEILHLPIVVTEQYPEGLGPTVGALKAWLGEHQEYLTKTTFSGCGDEAIKKKLLSMPIDDWVVAGIEAHVCVLQTVKDLLMNGKHVVVLNDCISSRSIYDYSTAIAEMRDYGARISSVETTLFELMGDAKIPEFKQISHLIK